MHKIKIIGFGVVGQNMRKIFHDAVVHDPGRGLVNTDPCDLAIICVPTEMNPDGSADISIVNKVITEHDAEYYLIKSTVPPGTTDIISIAAEKDIVFSPEYFGGTEHANYHDYDFVIFGGSESICSKVADIYKRYVHPEKHFYITSARTAELVKYMENSWLALKVTFCNEFYRLADRTGVDYNILRELFIADPRVNRSHTFVYPEQPYYDSHCLNKDVPAVIAYAESMGYNLDLMKQVVSLNEKFKGR